MNLKPFEKFVQSINIIVTMVKPDPKRISIFSQATQLGRGFLKKEMGTISAEVYCKL